MDYVFRRTSRRSLGCVLLTAILTVQAAEVRLSEVKRLSNGQVQVVVTGDADDPVTVQGSTDLKDWQDLQTFSLTGSPVYYTDTEAASLALRTYRVRTTSGRQSVPSELSDLSEAQNRVFPAPEGRNTIQFAADGKLAFIVWRDQELIFRERSANGDWTEQIVSSGGKTFKPYLTFDFSAPREDYRFQPSAVLLYDSNSQPHIFKAAGKTIIHYTRSNGWKATETISNHAANAEIAVLEAAVGPNNVFHFAALSSGSPRNLTYASNADGQWSWTVLSTVSDPPLTYWAPPFAARWLAMDVDSRNKAHIAFRSSLDLTYDSAGHPRAYSELKYASNASGQWSSTVVSKPRDLSGEAANGASIAIGKDDKPSILTWYDERADTGSAQESRLLFHQQDRNGNWNSSVVVSRADVYIAGDGNKGAGFSPYLRFDPKGTAHIVYLDHAGEHFGNIGQQEYAGNVRHAWWSGNGWSFETLFQQNSPLKQEAVYPAFAISGSELALTVLERQTQWNYSSYPPLSNSKYIFRFLTKPL
jgi:hypothetical protein